MKKGMFNTAVIRCPSCKVKWKIYWELYQQRGNYVYQTCPTCRAKFRFNVPEETVEIIESVEESKVKNRKQKIAERRKESKVKNRKQKLVEGRVDAVITANPKLMSERQITKKILEQKEEEYQTYWNDGPKEKWYGKITVISVLETKYLTGYVEIPADIREKLGMEGVAAFVEGALSDLVSTQVMYDEWRDEGYFGEEISIEKETNTGAAFGAEQYWGGVAKTKREAERMYTIAKKVEDYEGGGVEF